jgi:ABC-type nitrate/sulfonate/bicarbonate transport system ATPase subunit
MSRSRELSGDSRYRVSIVPAMIPSYNLLLIDEPFAALSCGSVRNHYIH